MDDPDYLLALKLQQEYNKELNNLQPSTKNNDEDLSLKITPKKQAQKRRRSNEHEPDLNSTQNLVHPEWETLDPTPDVQAMFSAFDNKFFQGRLKCVLLEWSKKMYSCAGICYSRRNFMGMSITIRLSEPLLKLRPRKNLIETLLHEMIHAYCFVLGIREGNGGHGPNFKKIMHGINKVAGTNITVYHTFNDEVDLYKVHWWRCNGICQHRKPFFGYVKRTCNRAPGPNDFWWRNHVESCGGSFLKIKGPEPAKKGRKVKAEAKKSSDKGILKYFGNTTTSTTGSINRFNNFVKGPVKANGGGTLLLNSNTKTFTATKSSDNISSPKKSVMGGNLKNVVGLKDFGEETSGASKTRANSNSFPVSAEGYSLNRSSISQLPRNEIANELVDRDKLREIWSQRFSSTNSNKIQEPKSSEKDEEVVLVSETNQESSVEKTLISEEWEVLSDDIFIRNIQPEIINLSDEDESEIGENIKSQNNFSKLKIPLTQEERHTQIKKEILDNSDLSEDDIELIDDDYDDAITNAVDLTDTSLIDDFFSDDAFLKDFKIENSLVPSGSRSFPNPNKDIVTCPICQGKVTREHFEDHLDGCIGISTKIEPKSYGGRVVPGSRIIQPLSNKRTRINNTQKEVLKKAGYSEKEIENIKITHVNTSNSDEVDSNEGNMTEGQHRRRGLTTSTHACPVCGVEVDVNRIDDHLQICDKNSPPTSSFQMSQTRRNSTPKPSEDFPFQICPVCSKKVRANMMNEHLDLCLVEFDDDF